MTLQIEDFNYQLPESAIAQEPVAPRDHSKLLILNRKTGAISHKHFYDIPDYLGEGDVLILNQSKVFPARLFGIKDSGGKVEVLLLRQLSDDSWEALSRPGLKMGRWVNFPQDLVGTVVACNEDQGFITLQFNEKGKAFVEKLYAIGKTPVPPYISATQTEADLRKSYQTVYARNLGSAAAPTAGLHFTSKLLNTLESKGVQIEYVTLHVGPGTFQNLRPENIKAKALHAEQYEITEDTASRLNQAKEKGKRIVTVGTTSIRTIESAVEEKNQRWQVKSGTGSTTLFIYPPYPFRFVDALITNFHLPKSSLLMLISAFVSSPNTDQPFSSFATSLVGNAYQEAKLQDYRFYSFGDAMMIG